MSTLFGPDYGFLWALVLALALFFPVRQLIWVLYVRRAQKQSGGDVEAAEQARLKKRASVTAALLCFVFAVIYTNYLFQGTP
jgi:hypothetical protein